MPRLFNVDSQPMVIDYSRRAVMPGESYDFTDEQAAAGIAGQWSETDPREGLSDERVFKLARDTSRQDLDAQASTLGVDTSALQTKQDVAQAIQAALDTAAQTIEDNSPAESGDTKE